MKTRTFFISATLLLISCATVYKPYGIIGGYSDTQLAEDVFQVSFRGNGYTSSERVSDFCLLRSAELTIKHGYRYFVVVESEKGSQISKYTTPSTSYTYGSVYGTGNYALGSATTTTHGGQTYLIAKPSATNTIICYKEKPDSTGLVFDATFITKSIREKYGIRK